MDRSIIYPAFGVTPHYATTRYVGAPNRRSSPDLLGARFFEETEVDVNPDNVSSHRDVSFLMHLSKLCADSETVS